MLFKKVIVIIFLLSSAILTLSSKDTFKKTLSDNNFLGENLYLFEDATGSISDSSIIAGLHDHLFIQSKKDVPNYGVTSSTIWAKFVVENNKSEQNKDWILFIKNALLDSITLYEPIDERKWKRTLVGDHLKFNNRPIPHHNFAFHISPSDGGERHYYARFKTTGSLQLPIEVLSDNSFRRFNQVSELFYGLFTGAMLIMFFYNLFVYFSLKDFAYLAYCIFIFANVTLQTVYSGHVFQYILFNNPYLANLSVPILMAFLPASVALFSLSFLSPKNINVILRRMLYGIIVVSIFLMISTFFLPIRISTSIAGMIIMLTLIVAIFAGILSWIGGNRSAKFYVIAWILLIISGLITALRNFGLIEVNFITLHGSRIATVIEVILLAFSLADKYNIFKKEKEAAQLELINMQQEANRQLEQKVKERTLELATTNDRLNDTLVKVELERKKSDKLLLNVLPEAIAQELKENGKVAPRHYQLASVLFTDFINFTKLAENLSPQEVLEALDECFLAFDDICQKNNLEKIKTIGDGYMAVGGLPIENKSNPNDAIMAGIEMQEWISTRNLERAKNNEKLWEIRIGVHSGPLIAGVIGKHKFVYDIWGDTVNMASRMESSGETGKVHISQDTFDLVKDNFKCQHLGQIQVKNKGLVDAYSVTARII